MGGPERVQGYLAAQGITRGELESTIRRDLTIRAFIENRLGAGIQVTEADAQAFYAENPSLFTTKDSVRARHIIILTSPDDPDSVRAAKRKQIEGVLALARKGGDFSRLARKYSEGPSARNGGDLGYFARDGMVKPFSDAAFALQPGQISDVVETQFGFHIIKVEARTKSYKISFEDAHDRIIEGLQQRALSSELENHLKRSRSVAIIEPNFDFGGLTQRESTTFTR
jgi:peptidyl-prolyl cis-trans isomerase C